MTKTNLKYRFIALYKDGTNYVQNSEDLSVKGEGSSFSDVNLDNLEEFYLCKKGYKVGVNLTNKCFIINNAITFMGDPISKPGRAELIYFRRHHKAIGSTGSIVGQYTLYVIGFRFEDKEYVLQLT